jgi:hypothetical protein
VICALHLPPAFELTIFGTMEYRLLNGKEVIDLTEEEEEASPTDSPPRAGSSELSTSAIGMSLVEH